MVAVRDKLTARGLKRYGINVFAPGNPMMDGFVDPSQNSQSFLKSRRLILLCGSRMPESLRNLATLLHSVEKLNSQNKNNFSILILLGVEPLIGQVEQRLSDLGFIKSQTIYSLNSLSADAVWSKGSLKLYIGIGKFYQWAKLGELGVANAGTATEQLVGLGIPCVSLPGKGPQFKKSFARRQSRLLGGAVIPCQSAEHLAQVTNLLISNDSLRKELACIGKRRMHSSGNSKELSSLLFKFLIDN